MIKDDFENIATIILHLKNIRPILNLMPPTHTNKVGTRQKKIGKIMKVYKKTPGRTFYN